LEITYNNNVRYDVVNLKSDIDYFWKNIQKEKNWMKTFAPTNEKNQIFFQFDKSKKCIVAFHKHFGFVNIKKSNIQINEKFVQENLKKKELVFDFDPKRFVTHNIFFDYMLPRRKDIENKKLKSQMKK